MVKNAYKEKSCISFASDGMADPINAYLYLTKEIDNEKRNAARVHNMGDQLECSQTDTDKWKCNHEKGEKMNICLRSKSGRRRRIKVEVVAVFPLKQFNSFLAKRASKIWELSPEGQMIREKPSRENSTLFNSQNDETNSNVKQNEDSIKDNAKKSEVDASDQIGKNRKFVKFTDVPPMKMNYRITGRSPGKQRTGFNAKSPLLCIVKNRNNDSNFYYNWSLKHMDYVSRKPSSQSKEAEPKNRSVFTTPTVSNEVRQRDESMTALDPDLLLCPPDFREEKQMQTVEIVDDDSPLYKEEKEIQTVELVKTESQSLSEEKSVQTLCAKQGSSEFNLNKKKQAVSLIKKVLCNFKKEKDKQTVEYEIKQLSDFNDGKLEGSVKSVKLESHFQEEKGNPSNRNLNCEFSNLFVAKEREIVTGMKHELFGFIKEKDKRSVNFSNHVGWHLKRRKNRKTAKVVMQELGKLTGNKGKRDSKKHETSDFNCGKENQTNKIINEELSDIQQDKDKEAEALSDLSQTKDNLVTKDLKPDSFDFTVNNTEPANQELLNFIEGKDNEPDKCSNPELNQAKVQNQPIKDVKLELPDFTEQREIRMINHTKMESSDLNRKNEKLIVQLVKVKNFKEGKGKKRNKSANRELSESNKTKNNQTVKSVIQESSDLVEQKENQMANYSKVEPSGFNGKKERCTVKIVKEELSDFKEQNEKQSNGLAKEIQTGKNLKQELCDVSEDKEKRVANYAKHESTNLKGKKEKQSGKILNEDLSVSEKEADERANHELSNLNQTKENQPVKGVKQGLSDFMKQKENRVANYTKIVSSDFNGEKDRLNVKIVKQELSDLKERNEKNEQQPQRLNLAKENQIVQRLKQELTHFTEEKENQMAKLLNPETSVFKGKKEKPNGKILIDELFHFKKGFEKRTEEFENLELSDLNQEKENQNTKGLKKELSDCLEDEEKRIIKHTKYESSDFKVKKEKTGNILKEEFFNFKRRNENQMDDYGNNELSDLHQKKQNMYTKIKNLKQGIIDFTEQITNRGTKHVQFETSDFNGKRDRLTGKFVKQRLFDEKDEKEFVTDNGAYHESSNFDQPKNNLTVRGLREEFPDFTVVKEKRAPKRARCESPLPKRRKGRLSTKVLKQELFNLIEVKEERTDINGNHGLSDLQHVKESVSAKDSKDPSNFIEEKEKAAINYSKYESSDFNGEKNGFTPGLSNFKNSTNEKTHKSTNHESSVFNEEKEIQGVDILKEGLSHFKEENEKWTDSYENHKLSDFNQEKDKQTVEFLNEELSHFMEEKENRMDMNDLSNDNQEKEICTVKVVKQELSHFKEENEIRELSDFNQENKKQTVEVLKQELSHFKEENEIRELSDFNQENKKQTVEVLKQELSHFKENNEKRTDKNEIRELSDNNEEKERQAVKIIKDLYHFKEEKECQRDVQLNESSDVNGKKKKGALMSIRKEFRRYKKETEKQSNMNENDEPSCSNLKGKELVIKVTVDKGNGKKGASTDNCFEVVCSNRSLSNDAKDRKKERELIRNKIRKERYTKARVNQSRQNTASNDLGVTSDCEGEFKMWTGRCAFAGKKKISFKTKVPKANRPIDKPSRKLSWTRGKKMSQRESSKCSAKINRDTSILDSMHSSVAFSLNSKSVNSMQSKETDVNRSTSTFIKPQVKQSDGSHR